jgi:hypothetical protein
VAEERSHVTSEITLVRVMQYTSMGTMAPLQALAYSSSVAAMMDASSGIGARLNLTRQARCCFRPTGMDASLEKLRFCSLL